MIFNNHVFQLTIAVKAEALKNENKKIFPNK